MLAHDTAQMHSNSNKQLVHDKILIISIIFITILEVYYLAAKPLQRKNIYYYYIKLRTLVYHFILRLNEDEIKTH